MSGKDHRDNKRVPVALRIKLRFRNVDTFISKFATNISSTGMFISSRKPREAGTQLRFELRLADDSTVIAGKGRVVWVRDYDSAHPKEPHGMGIEFVSLSKASRNLISQIVQQRVHQGLGENENIPHSLEPAEEEVVAEVAAALPAIKEPGAKSAPQPHSRPSPSSAALTLEKLDETNIDLSAVLKRARELVGKGHSDRELDALFRVSAAPIAETVDDASNKLAQILGGKAVVGRRARHRDPVTDHAALADIIPQDAPTPIPEGDSPKRPQDSKRSARAPSEDAIDIEDADIESAREALPLAAHDDLGTDSVNNDEPVTVVGGDPAFLSDSTLGHEQESLDESFLDSTLSSLADDNDEPLTKSRAQTDEEPIIISDELADDFSEDSEARSLAENEFDLDMLEDDQSAARRGRAATSAPNGIHVGVLDPAELEDNGIYELSKPGTGPIDLLKLADLPRSRGQDEDDDDGEDIEFDLPDVN